MECAKSSLEIALDYYDLQLAAQQRTLNGHSKVDVKKARDDQLEFERKHLKRQRRHLTVLSSIQAKLDEYREEGREALVGTREERKMTRKNLEAEPHHPTKVLARFMAAEGKPKPSPNHSAHHIVPGKGRINATYLARVHMHISGIRINDPDNGVWLPTSKKHTPHWSMPSALAHKQYHTKVYESTVSNRIRSKSTEQAIRRELNFIEKQIIENQIELRQEEA